MNISKHCRKILYRTVQKLEVETKQKNNKNDITWRTLSIRDFLLLDCSTSQINKNGLVNSKSKTKLNKKKMEFVRF